MTFRDRLSDPFSIVVALLVGVALLVATIAIVRSVRHAQSEQSEAVTFVHPALA